MRPDWLASIRELRGMTVAVSVILHSTSTFSRLGWTRTALPTGTPRICGSLASQLLQVRSARSLREQELLGCGHIADQIKAPAKLHRWCAQSRFLSSIDEASWHHASAALSLSRPYPDWCARADAAGLWKLQGALLTNHSSDHVYGLPVAPMLGLAHARMTLSAASWACCWKPASPGLSRAAQRPFSMESAAQYTTTHLIALPSPPQRAPSCPADQDERKACTHTRYTGLAGTAMHAAAAA